MAGIRARNTKPEILIRSLLHASGCRFRLHVDALPGKPDIVLPKYKAVVLVHGCFWHGHGCRFFRWPATRPEFWRTKIERNRANAAVPEDDDLRLTLLDWLKGNESILELRE